MVSNYRLQGFVTFFCLGLLLLTSVVLASQPYPDYRQVDYNLPSPMVYQYTIYYPGNIPILLTNEHDGRENYMFVQNTQKYSFMNMTDKAKIMSPASFSTPIAPNRTMPQMPARTSGQLILDFNSGINTRYMASSLSYLLSKRPLPADFAGPPSVQKPIPHVVIFRIQRRFVDANRQLAMGVGNGKGRKNSVAAWNEFHDLVHSVQALIRHQQLVRRPTCNLQAQGLLLDIHGQTHSHQQLEIGYAIPGPTYRQTNAQLNARINNTMVNASIRFLISRMVSHASSDILTRNPLPQEHSNDGDAEGMSQETVVPQEAIDTDEAADLAGDDDTEEVDKEPIANAEWNANQAARRVQYASFLRGKESLGAMLERYGVDVMPGPKTQTPPITTPISYYSGGYTVQVHGSGAYNFMTKLRYMDAVQLELPSKYRVNISDDDLKKFSFWIAQGCDDYYHRYYTFCDNPWPNP
ncbi:hypothetical protein BG015_004087 [Linnemannia schmuckeri]|uniref:Uncharacterized protein n=1 Tax=Linnemannia schmuckeri TaxID=64567 RepID=A0A9P5RGR4_9FUNG|nr:hypothetical protein BG015_004087 [Linnemannia schmuckeri]